MLQAADIQSPKRLFQGCCCDRNHASGPAASYSGNRHCCDRDPRFDSFSVTERIPAGRSEFAWEFLSPGKLLPELVRKSPRLRATLEAAVREKRPTAASPWRLIVAYDEFAPGNKLKTDNTRMHNVQFALGTHGRCGKPLPETRYRSARNEAVHRFQPFVVGLPHADHRGHLSIKHNTRLRSDRIARRKEEYGD